MADIDRDGHVDVVAGPRWFAGPEFKRSTVYRSPHAFDRLSYSNNFLTFTADFNRDDWPDILVIGWPGKEAHWFENPGAPPKPAPLTPSGAQAKPPEWRQHLAYAIVDSESPGFGDITGDGRPEIVAASAGRLGWMEPNWEKPYAPWSFHPISPPGRWFRYTHGIGFGDINGDGRADFLEAAGWWEQPADRAGDPIWKFNAQAFGRGGAQMYAYDVNGDGRADVVTSLWAHGYGISWFEQVTNNAGAMSWREHPITSARPTEKLNGVQFSQPHALMLADLDGDGLRDVIVGKRHWAHGPDTDPEANSPAVLYWFRLKRGVDGAVTFMPHLIDDDSGVGTQFPVGDLNGDGRTDVAIANKKGVFVFLQEPAP